MSTTTPTKKKKFTFSSLIFKEDEKVGSENTNTNTNQNTVVPTNMYEQTVQTTVTGVGTIVPQIKADLEKVLNDNNFPGEDYLELREAAGMSKIGLDNTTAMKAAFATLSARGLSKEKAITTANQYIEILNKEKEAFNKTVEKQLEFKVQKPNGEINDLNIQNQELAKQIQTITESINKNNELIVTKKNESAQAQISIENTKKNYEATHGLCVKEIQDDIVKINTLIQ